MRRIFVVLILLAACGHKKEGGGGSGTGSGSETKPVVDDKPMTCPAGNVVQDGKCVAVVTAEKIDAVAKQQTRLDDLAKILDKIDTVSAPIELLNAFRKLDQWKTLTEQIEKLKMVDSVIGDLDTGVKTLRTFKAGLGEASGRLGNLKGELDRLMKDTGNARKIEEVRTQISSSLKAALQPLADQVTDTIKNALTPLLAKLEEVGDVIDLTCASAKLGGAGNDTKELCKKAKAAFKEGLAYLDDFKLRPAKLFEDVYGELGRQLAMLLDAESKKLLDQAQTKVNEALKLPAGSGSGSAK